MSNVFKAPGSSRANKQQHNNMAVANGAMPLYNDYSKFLQNMQPTINQAYGNLFNMGSQPNITGHVNQMQQQALLNSMMANRAAMNMYGNGALAQGAGINAMNKGMDAANAYSSQQYNPATQMQQMSSALGAMQQPLQNMDQLSHVIYGQPQVPVGKSGLDYVAQFAGMKSGNSYSG